MTAIVYDEFDQYNRNQYYSQVEDQLSKKTASMPQMMEERESYGEHMRTFFHTSDILSHQKSN